MTVNPSYVSNKNKSQLHDRFALLIYTEKTNELNSSKLRKKGIYLKKLTLKRNQRNNNLIDIQFKLDKYYLTTEKILSLYEFIRETNTAYIYIYAVLVSLIHSFTGLSNKNV